MTVAACDLPSVSALREEARRAYFHDSYSVPLARPELDMVAIFYAIFGHPPAWLRLMLHIRNVAAGAVGLAAPTIAQIENIEIKTRHVVGEKLGGIWPILSMSEREIVAGKDDKHLDFKLSILRVQSKPKDLVVVTTVCKVHNVFGKAYLGLIVPFHKFSLQRIMTNAAAAKRL